SCSLPSWPASFYAGCLQQLGQFLARIKQARLHSVFRYPDDFSRLFHGFLVVVDKIDDLPVFWRKCSQTLAQCFTGILLLRPFFCAVTSGSSDVSSIALAASSSSSTSFLRRSADRALNLVIAKSQVETADRPSNL